MVTCVLQFANHPLFKAFHFISHFMIFFFIFLFRFPLFCFYCWRNLVLMLSVFLSPCQLPVSCSEFFNCSQLCVCFHRLRTDLQVWAHDADSRKVFIMAVMSMFVPLESFWLNLGVVRAGAGGVGQLVDASNDGQFARC